MLPLRDNVPTRSRPVVTYALILANVLAWVLYQLPGLQASVDELGYHPCEVQSTCPTVGEGWLLTAITSMFLHGSWAHLLGGVAALTTQTIVTLMYASEADATIPNVGASGAISAVLGAYLVLLPRARVLTLIVFVLREIPAAFFLLIWFGFQLLDGSASLSHPEQGGGVAFFAHIGGFVFGAAAVKLFQKRRPLAPAY
jgi:membrane associated rhomboid family serine protease